MPGRAQLVAERARCGGPARRWRWRSAGRSRVPDHRRLALVGDADGGDVAARRCPAFASASCSTPDCVAQISVGVVLHPARLREDLPELLLARPPARCRAWSNTMARELVVPWSRARMNGIGCPPCAGFSCGARMRQLKMRGFGGGVWLTYCSHIRGARRTSPTVRSLPVASPFAVRLHASPALSSTPPPAAHAPDHLRRLAARRRVVRYRRASARRQGPRFRIADGRAAGARGRPRHVGAGDDRPQASTMHAYRGEDRRHALSRCLRSHRARVRASSSAQIWSAVSASGCTTTMGGINGCTHVTELLGSLPTAAVQTFAGLAARGRRRGQAVPARPLPRARHRRPIPCATIIRSGIAEPVDAIRARLTGLGAGQ